MDEITIEVHASVLNDATALFEARQGVDAWSWCEGDGEILPPGSIPQLELNESGSGGGDVLLKLGWSDAAEDDCPGCDATFVFDPEEGSEGRWVVYINDGFEHDSNIYDHEYAHVLDMVSTIGSGCENSITHHAHPSWAEVSSCDCESADGYNRTASEGGGQGGGGGECRPGSAEWPDCEQTPLVFDIDGDRHIPTVSADSDRAVQFDLNADGTTEWVGWLANPAEDAFLWLDLNGNSLLDDASELFGSATLLSNGETADHGYAALAQYDRAEAGGDGDGAITPNDAIWASLQLWFDLNGDGVSQSGESSSLGDHEIEVVSLRYARNKRVDDQGNIHTRRGHYWAASTHGRSPRPTRRGRIEDIAFRTRDPS
jgi:hypothetical protein